MWSARYYHFVAFENEAYSLLSLQCRLHRDEYFKFSTRCWKMSQEQTVWAYAIHCNTAGIVHRFCAEKVHLFLGKSTHKKLSWA